MKSSVLFALVLLSAKLIGQHHAVDSLKQQLSLHTKEDTERVQLYLHLSTEETYDHPAFAENYALEGKALAEKINYPEGIAIAYRLIGAAFWSQANHSAALANFLQGLKIADSLHLAQVQADLTGNLGMVYSDLGNFTKALTYYRTSLIKQQELKNAPREAVMNIDIGNGYYHLNQFDSALFYYLKGVEMMAPYAKTSRAIIDLGTIGVGDAYAGLGDFEEAIKYYEKAKGSSDTTRHNRGMAHSRISLANLFIKEKRFAEAEKELLECLGIAKAVNLKTYVRDSYELLANVADHLKKPVESYHYFKLYVLYKDSIQSSTVNSKIASLQLEYEIQRKQFEINNLTKEAKLKNTILLSVFLGIVLISASLFIAIRNFQKQKSLNLLLRERNHEIMNQQATLARQRDEVLALNEEIRAQQEEVIFQRDALADKNRSIEILNQQVTQYNLNLEKKVAERTASLREQNSRLEEYAFINAHKLRAPVASIIGLINLLQKELPADEQKEMILYLKKSSEELDQVIRSISNMLHKEGPTTETSNEQ